MDEEEIGMAVMAYLRKKGYTESERALQEEQNRSSSATSRTDPDIATQILSFGESESGPLRYREGYSKLRTWAYSSLDLYKYSYELLLQYLQNTVFNSAWDN